MIGLACRMRAGLQAPPGAAGPPGPPAVTTQKVKLEKILNQYAEGEVEMLSDPEIQTRYARYFAKFGCMPHEDAEATKEQLTAVSYVLASGHVPYADFSIFGPHGHRLQKRLRLQGTVFDPSMIGSGQQVFRSVELYGPPNFRNWRESHVVVKTCFIMENAIDLGVVDSYAEKIESYATLYGPEAWVLVYQSDVRARSELAERERRRGLSESAAAALTGATHPFDDARPWNWVYQEIVKNDRWWKKELEDPALLYLTKVKQMKDVLGGDAVVAQDGGTGSSSALSGYPHTPDGRPPRGAGKPGGGLSPITKRTGREQEKPPGHARVHLVNEGKFVANRSGNPLCPDHNSASGCSTAGPYCDKGVHQCNICLRQGHKSGDPACSGQAPSAAAFKGGGRGGRGKGGRGGRRGKGGKK